MHDQQHDANAVCASPVSDCERTRKTVNFDCYELQESETLPDRLIRSFYDSLVNKDFPNAVERLTRLSSGLRNRRDSKLLLSYSQGLQGNHGSTRSATLPVSRDDQYAHCLHLYMSGEYINALRASESILIYTFWSIPEIFLEPLGLSARTALHDRPLFLHPHLGRTILLHAAILYRLGYVSRSALIYGIIKKSSPEFSELASYNYDLCAEGTLNVNFKMYSDYIKTNELILLAREGRKPELMARLEQLKLGELQFKGSRDDLKYIEVLAGSRSDDSINSLLLRARGYFEKGEWETTKRILCKARENERTSPSMFRIINFNHALTCICSGDFDDGIKILERASIDGTPQSVVVSLYCTALILIDATEKAADCMESLTVEKARAVNLGLALLYCTKGNWEFGLLRLVDSDGDWLRTKEIILRFLLEVSEGRVRCDQFEDWNSVLERIVLFLKQKNNAEIMILCKLIEKLILPTIEPYC